jgi:hypothetical protein
MRSLPITPASPLQPPESWAEVRARGRVMRYRRTGAGRTVLLLPSLGGPSWPGLDAALATGFRVIVPEPPAPGIDLATWTAAFLEGLGVPTVAVIAPHAWSLAVLELTLRDVDQVACVVLLVDDAADEPAAAADGTLTSAGRAASVPLLVVRHDPADGDPVARIARFLGA